MTQRLGLARVLLHDPQVLLLDEPASGLDPRARIEMRGLLKRLQGLGKTILVSSHILPELADICNRVGIIEYGRLLACGDVQDLLAQVRGRPVIRIRVAGPPEAAAQGCWRRAPRPPRVTVRDGEVLVALADGVTDPSPLAARLVAEGHRLVSMREQEVNLETAFLELTRGSLGQAAGGVTTAALSAGFCYLRPLPSSIARCPSIRPCDRVVVAQENQSCMRMSTSSCCLVVVVVVCGRVRAQPRCGGTARGAAAAGGSARPRRHGLRHGLRIGQQIARRAARR